jgi:hypothetical protein
MPACAGLMVAPTATALTVSAAEKAMMVRLIEDPNMCLFPFLRAASRGSGPKLFMKRAKRRKRRILWSPAS